MTETTAVITLDDVLSTLVPPTTGYARLVGESGNERFFRNVNGRWRALTGAVGDRRPSGGSIGPRNGRWRRAEDAGAIFDGKSLFDNVNALAGPDGVKTTEGFIRGMFTKQYPMDAVNWVIQENLKFPREYAARLLFDHATNDWRDLIPAINIPTLVVGGKASLVPWKSQVWVGSQIKGAQTEIFEENEGGAHFMFMENPEKFNRLVKAFNG